MCYTGKFVSLKQMSILYFCDCIVIARTCQHTDIMTDIYIAISFIAFDYICEILVVRGILVQNTVTNKECIFENKQKNPLRIV